MNYGARLASFEDRGFRRDSAKVNVLIESALQVLFSRFPDHFVFFGGASLVLFYGSQRHSADLDLWLNSKAPPSHDEIITAILPQLTEAAEALGFPPVAIESATPLGDIVKLSVTAGESPYSPLTLRGSVPS